MAKKTASEKKVDAAFHEVHENIPSNVKATGKTGAAKEKMLTAVALSKARRAGAKIPKGGNTDLSQSSMKGCALTHDRKDNLAAKQSFRTRRTGMVKY